MSKSRFIWHAIKASAETAEDRAKLTGMVAEAGIDAPPATTAEAGPAKLDPELCAQP